MPVVPNELVELYKSWWESENSGALISVSYQKENAGDDKKYLTPWMEGDASWIFARAVSRAHKSGSMSPVRDALDVMERELAGRGYAGAGFPSLTLNTGAGCLAAFITGYENYYSETVWFELEKPWDYDKILSLKPEDADGFAETTLEAVRLAAGRFKGQAVITNLDLGGLADVLSSLRRTDGFLYDTADRPGDVKAALSVIHEIWKVYYKKVADIIGPANGGLHTSWTAVLSDRPYYPSQCDACAMISPAMFGEFVAPTLGAEFAMFERTMYHLDGSGEIPHLAALCENPSLAAIQWVPEPSVPHADPRYLPLYESIITRGRKIVFNNFRGSFDDLKNLFKIFPRGAFCVTIGAKDREEAERAAEL